MKTVVVKFDEEPWKAAFTEILLCRSLMVTSIIEDPTVARVFGLEVADGDGEGIVVVVVTFMAELLSSSSLNPSMELALLLLEMVLVMVLVMVMAMVKLSRPLLGRRYSLQGHEFE